MAYHRPDLKLKEARKIINNLDDSKESELIRYYIKKKDDWINEQSKRLEEYQDIFNKMSKFIK